MFFSLPVPKISKTTTKTINQCQMLNDPITILQGDTACRSTRQEHPAF
jgi:hypothetical protein